MGVFFQKLLGTVELRPYVFAFLATYFIFSIIDYRAKKSVLYALIAYFLAWVCEWGSIHYGIPFGPYKYVNTTLHKELWFFGVPVFDSMSFIFLGYFSHHASLLWFSNPKPNMLAQVLMSGFLMMFLDIIIDPLTLLGSKWFLGEIYYYPNPGPYFGVTLENFWGWFFLGCVLSLLCRFIFGTKLNKRIFFQSSYLLVYFGIAAFNLVITFSIKELQLAWVGVFIYLPILLHYGVRSKARWQFR